MCMCLCVSVVALQRVITYTFCRIRAKLVVRVFMCCDLGRRNKFTKGQVHWLKGQGHIGNSHKTFFWPQLECFCFGRLKNLAALIMIKRFHMLPLNAAGISFLSLVPVQCSFYH